MAELPPDRHRVIWTRPDGETIVVSEHASREAAEVVVNLIRGACDSTQPRIEPVLQMRKGVSSG